MTRHYYLLSCLFISFLLVTLTGECQLSRGGFPASSGYSLPPVNRNLTTITPPNLATIQKEDDLNPLPYRMAVVLPVDVDIKNTGEWTDLSDGSRIWRSAIHAPGSLALTAYFDKFHLPEGGKLFLYNPEKNQVIGAFTDINNNPQGVFATELIRGENIILEYDQPAFVSELPVIHISEMAYAYRGFGEQQKNGAYEPDASSCEVNVNCPEGDNWQKQKKGVVRLLIKKGNGAFWCTGSLVNNVRKNQAPYVLTADHCGTEANADDLLKWIFYFDYEAPECQNPDVPPIPISLTGATLKSQSGNAVDLGSDFYLVLLNQSIPDSNEVVYNGWTHVDTTSPNGVSLHHPGGDLKKISTYTTPLISSPWQKLKTDTHWQVVWAATQNGHGVTEGGSSGSPLFDSKGRIMGTLTGGQSACDSAFLNLPDYYGKVSFHWDMNGEDSTKNLKYWLDPDNTGALVLDLLYHQKPPPPPPPPQSITLYPVPFHDNLNIKLTGTWPATMHVTIHNIIGARVIDEDISIISNLISYTSVSRLTSGVFVIKLSTPDFVISRKIVKL
ncbi:MAG: T9SS type A sorting domain-containing protein [Bacteroidetes bacterium]|nr:T9SS type A sorting domain-containing protein [Bacteroidota bacterium]